MRHVTVDEWSTRDGVLHRRDARAKLVAVLTLLLTISLSTKAVTFVAIGALLAAGFLLSRAPAGGFIARVGVLLLFPLTFAGLVALSRDPDRAVLLLTRSSLSLTAILLTVSTTPMPHILTALRRFGLPVMLVEVVQFVYRYLFVLGEEAWHMRTAAALRGGRRSLPAAASTAGVLFGRAYGRAEGIHRSIASRSFSGLMSVPARAPFTLADAALAGAIAGIAVCCLLLERLA